MSEEFFKVLWQEASLKLRWEYATCGDAINATIEALKEMMVGEPIGAIGGSQGTDSAGEYNIIIIPPTASARSHCTFVILGHHGISGEEVTVFVVRDG